MDLESVLSGVTGALTVAVFEFFLLRRQGRLEDRVNVLEEEKFASLESKVEKHHDADRSQEILTELRSLGGAVMRLSDSTARSLENIAEQNARLSAHDLMRCHLNDFASEHVRVYHHGKQ
ncbi:MAG: hypothetical protein IKB22_08735 [Lentisphaeria bacterium]|nr:hypothetical protein [Lentisphaeria bacterium]